MGSRKFEVVKEFIYLGTEIIAHNKIYYDSTHNIGHSVFIWLITAPPLQMISSATKVKLYNKLIVRVFIYGDEVWALIWILMRECLIWSGRKF